MAIAYKDTTLKLKSKQTNYICPKSWCNRAFSKRFAYFQHQRSCTKRNSSFIKSLSKKVPPCETKTKKHMLKNRDVELEHKCMVCNEPFDDKASYNSHISICSYISKNGEECEENISVLRTLVNSDVDADVIGIHTNPDPKTSILETNSTEDSLVFCALEDSVSDSASGSQSKSSSKTCHICKKVFTRRTNLRRHLITHSKLYTTHSKGPKDPDNIVDSDILIMTKNSELHVNLPSMALGDFERTKRSLIESSLSFTPTLVEPDIPQRNNPTLSEDMNVCHLCDKTFSTKTNLRRHLTSHEKNLSSECSLTSFNISNDHLTVFVHAILKNTTNEKEASHSKDKSHLQTCPVSMTTDTYSCNSNTGYKIAEHVKCQGKVKDFSKTCFICHKTLTSREDLLQHMTRHSLKQKMIYPVYQNPFLIEESESLSSKTLEPQIERKFFFCYDDLEDTETIHVVYPSDYQIDPIKSFDNNSSNEIMPTSNSIVCSSLSPSNNSSAVTKRSPVKEDQGRSGFLKNLKMCYICKKTFTRNTNLRKHLIAGKCKCKDLVQAGKHFYSYNTNEDLNFHRLSIDYDEKSILNSLNNKALKINDESIPIVYPSDCIPASFLTNESNHFVHKDSEFLDPNRVLDFDRNDSDIQSTSLSDNDKLDEQCNDCHMCSKTFMKGYNLQRHLKTHMEGYILNRFNYDTTKDIGTLISPGINQNTDTSAPGTSKSIIDSACIKKIAKYRDNIARRTCNICHKVFTRSTTLRRHMSIHQKPVLKCNICQNSYLTKDKFDKHFKFCSFDKKLTNDIIHKNALELDHDKGVPEYNISREVIENPPVFKNAEDHVRITKIVSDQKIDRQHVRSPGYNYLLAKAKSKLISRTCKICKKTFTRTTTLRRHMLIHKRSIYKCKGCQVCFSNQDLLNRHLVKCEHSINSGQSSSKYAFVKTVSISNENANASPSRYTNGTLSLISTNESSKRKIHKKTSIKTTLPENLYSLQDGLSKDPAISDNVIIVKPSDHQNITSYHNISSGKQSTESSSMIFKHNSLKHGAVQFSNDVKRIKSASFGRDVHHQNLSDTQESLFKENSSPLGKTISSLMKYSSDLYTPKVKSTDEILDDIIASDNIKSFQVKWKQKAARTCQICNKTFSRTTTLRRHMNIHNRNENYKCDRCKLDVQGQDVFNLHCKECDNTTDKTVKNDIIIDIKKPVIVSRSESTITVKAHKESSLFLTTKTSKKIPNISNKTCHICHKIFTRTTTLRRHLLTHKDRPLFECEKCQKVFYRKDLCEKHQSDCSGTQVDLSHMNGTVGRKNSNNQAINTNLKNLLTKGSLGTSLKVLRYKRFSS